MPQLADDPRHVVLLFWSGGTSEKVAQVLAEWLPAVLPGVRPWVSHEIPKGTLWFEMLRAEIARGKSAILCVTAANIASPWLHFEAGAAWKGVEDPFVTPLLFRIDRNLLRLPLSSFQAAELSSSQDIRNLLAQINRRCPYPVADEVLVGNDMDAAFQNLRARLDEIETDAPDLHPFYDIAEAARWVRCHGTKFGVPRKEFFWNSLLTAAKRRFVLLGNSNKSWLDRTDLQSRMLADAIVRICLAGGTVDIVSGRDEIRAIARTKRFFEHYLFADRTGETPIEKSTRIDALIERLRYSVIDRSNYRAVISDERALIIPALNTNEFSDESMVIELDQRLQQEQFNNYNGDIERLKESGDNYFPQRWASELTHHQITYLHSPTQLFEGLGRLGLVARDLVFYVTSACNLRCKHCYIGNTLLNAAQFWPRSTVCELLRATDLDRLTLVGGEPLQYYAIDDVLEVLRTASITEKRITTNLTHISDATIGKLNAAGCRVTVSVDGATADVHDAIRGPGAFNKTIQNIKRLVAAGVDVEVTNTVTSRNVNTFDALVGLLRGVGVRRLNLHKISPQGNALQSSNLLLSPSEWRHFLKTVLRNGATSKADRITVRYPLLFATESEFSELVGSEYHHHAAGSYYSSRGHRVVLYATGEVFVSSEAFGTDAAIGRIVEGAFVPNTGARSEVLLAAKPDFRISDINPQITGDSNFPVPLSFSFRKTAFI
jgi:sulfatase maturation enzyme AslB (radical SAM superfamily)